jgi:hypothetical protein
MQNITDGSSPAKYTVNGATCFQLGSTFSSAIIEWSEAETGTEWIPQGFEIDTPADFTQPQGVTLTIGTGYVRITAIGSCDFSIQDIRQR